MPANNAILYAIPASIIALTVFHVLEWRCCQAQLVSVHVQADFTKILKMSANHVLEVITVSPATRIIQNALLVPQVMSCS